MHMRRMLFASDVTFAPLASRACYELKRANLLDYRNHGSLAGRRASAYSTDRQALVGLRQCRQLEFHTCVTRLLPRARGSQRASDMSASGERPGPTSALAAAFSQLGHVSPRTACGRLAVAPGCPLAYTRPCHCRSSRLEKTGTTNS